MGSKHFQLWEKNLFLMALISLSEAVQIIFLLAAILHVLPFKPNHFVKDLYPYFQLDVHPEFEMGLYRLGIVVAVLLMAGLLYVFFKRIDEESLTRKFLPWLLMAWVCIAIQAWCVFKSIVWPDASWARSLFYFVLVFAYCVRIFWKEFIEKGIPLIQLILKKVQQVPQFAKDITAVLLIISCVWITDIPQALAVIFSVDKWYHFDGFIMSALWSVSRGLDLNIDVISQYSVVLPKFLGWLSTAIYGTISYANVLTCIVFLGTIYWGMFYALLRLCFQSWGLALAGTLLAIKWQMFHWGIWPLVWGFGSPTVIRHWFDVPVLALLYVHQRSLHQKWLWMAGCVAGIALGIMLDTGIYLSSAVCVYVGIFVFCHRQKWLEGLFGIAVIPVSAIIVAWASTGNHIGNPVFWHNMFEHAGLFLAGFGSLPITDGLSKGMFYCFFKGLLIPVFYLGFLLWHGGRFIDLKGTTRDGWLAAVAFYGLGQYHYYINRSAFTSFDVVCVPLVILLVSMCQQLLDNTSQLRRRQWTGCILGLVLVSLFTNQIFFIYPSIFHKPNQSVKEAEAFYQQWGDFSEDGNLIAQWSDPKERVALISSFETALLMEANRSPYFYYFPLIESKHWVEPDFQGTYLHQVKRMEKTLAQLITNPPRVIFVETKFIKSPLSKTFRQRHATLDKLLAHVEKHYTEVDTGKMVTVFKRRDQQ